MMTTTQKQIAMHETRMWIVQVVVPVAVIAGTFLANENNRKALKYNYNKFKNWCRTKMKGEEK